MKIKFRLSLTGFLAAFILFGAPATFANPATITWSGTDCIAPTTPNCDWSDVNNWVGGVAPAAGDNIIFDNTSLTGDEAVADDIASSTVFGDLTFQGSSQYAFLVVPYNNISNEANSVLAINGNVTDGIVSGSNSTVSGIYGSFTNAAATPDYNINDSFQFGFGPIGQQLLGSPQPSIEQAATVNFGANTANFIGSSGAVDIVNYAAMTGSGDTDFTLSADGDFQQLTASPAYTGNLDIQSGTLLLSPYLSPATMPDIFSAAAMITVEDGAGLVFNDPSATDTTIAEPLTVGGTGTNNCSNSGNAANCGAVYGAIDPNSTLTFTGAVVLTSNTQFNTDGTLKFTGALSGAFTMAQPYVGTVVLAGSSNSTNTVNGTYSAPSTGGGSGNSGGGSGNTGGGSGTSSAKKVKAPGTPDTGFALSAAHASLSFIVTAICTISMLMIADLARPANRKNVRA
ncbi:MAG TPA: hypothetical protein VG604_00585 [Candidatus Saccharimonadales bacterium]|nr:hypothetical protein [Candidatus Saccharimonadales bacterium]